MFTESHHLADQSLGQCAPQGLPGPCSPEALLDQLADSTPQGGAGGTLT
ncbi:hypothetical protein [Streptomyces griseus]|nr:hypothetical protein [Streptomyces griseus]